MIFSKTFLRLIHSSLFFICFSNCSFANSYSVLKEGELFYNSDLSTKQRIFVKNGDFLVGEYRLQHSPAPKNAHDGDSGVDLYFKIKDKSFLQNNNSLTLPHPSIEFYIVHWASPAGYKVFSKNQIRGNLTRIKYSHYKSLEFTFDGFYQEQGKTKKKLQKTLKFLQKKRWIQIQNVDWNWLEYQKDSPIAYDQIIYQKHLVGKWEGCEAYQKNKTIMKKFLICKTPYFIEFEKGQCAYKGRNDKKFFGCHLKQNKILNIAEQPNAIINYMSDKKMILTYNSNPEYLLRIVYNKK